MTVLKGVPRSCTHTASVKVKLATADPCPGYAKGQGVGEYWADVVINDFTSAEYKHNIINSQDH